MIDYTIYVGLNDQYSNQQTHPTEQYIQNLKTVCKHYHVAFSMHVAQGGFFFENGDFADEMTLCLHLVDAPKAVVAEIAKDLCTFFNQTTVMVTESPAEVYYVKGENLEKEKEDDT